jgi:guanine nucleotide-binding protein G(i) subunit alpha
MGCTNSSSANPAEAAAALKERKENKKIDDAQKQAILEKSKKIELIIIGTGDSGKTTLRKQLANVHNSVFQNEQYRASYSPVIIANLIDGVIEVMSVLGKKNTPIFKELEESTRSTPNCIDQKLAATLKGVIEEESFQDALKDKTGKEIQIQDCWAVFAAEFTKYPTWGGDKWIPSADDCVRSRVRTSGVIKEELEIDDLHFLLYDVGGQRAERRKWMPMFESVQYCIFVAALSEYDQVLFEDRSKNRLEEAFELFEEVINTSWLSQATTLLFLNKKDLFHQKFIVEKIPLNTSGRFPNAPTDNSDEDEAINWMANEFTSRRRGKGTTTIYVHITTATDPLNIKAVFAVVRDTILGKSLEAAGFKLGSGQMM